MEPTKKKKCKKRNKMSSCMLLYVLFGVEFYMLRNTDQKPGVCTAHVQKSLSRIFDQCVVERLERCHFSEFCELFHVVLSILYGKNFQI